jgi:hypothetical protein
MDRRGDGFDVQGVDSRGIWELFSASELNVGSLPDCKALWACRQPFTLNFEVTNAWIVTSITYVRVVVIKHSY